MLIKEIIFFITPLLLAGLIHHLFVIKFDLVKQLARPIDNNLFLGGQQLFGQSKTWRGIIVMTALSGLFYYYLSYWINIETNYPALISGMLIGLGYALGELPNSFIKRRLHIGASQSNYKGFKKIFYLIDQVDSVVGALILLYVVYQPSINLVLSILIISSLLHLLIDSYLHKFSYKKSNNIQ
ncbi:CDP-archaeol synthase [Candidatus Parcubacteria bacterium]|jgi:hypothetical protein|nr:CDP-archaeol synthase [Candidatus Parcubacteria bacterium]